MLKFRHFQKIVWPSYCQLYIYYFQTMVKILLLLFYFTQFFCIVHTLLHNMYTYNNWEYTFGKRIHNIHKKKTCNFFKTYSYDEKKFKNKNIHNNNENVPHLTPYIYKPLNAYSS